MRGHARIWCRHRNFGHRYVKRQFSYREWHILRYGGWKNLHDEGAGTRHYHYYKFLVTNYRSGGKSGWVKVACDRHTDRPN